MYVGDVSSVDATHHLLYEVFDNSIDEALAGHASRVDIVIHTDGSASVRDNGRGIPVDIHPEMGVSAAEVVFTTLHAGGKFDNDSYEFSGGLHGVGAACTNALSDWMQVEVTRDGGRWEARFEGGAVVKSIAKTRAMKKGEETGTHVRFLPSNKYLKETVFKRETLLGRFREVAFLNAGVQISLTDERLQDGEEKPFVEHCHFANGMSDFVAHIVGTNSRAVDVASFTGRHAGIEVDAAFTWVVEDQPEDIRAYTNNIPQSDGGQHVTGLRAAIAKTLMSFAEREKLLKRGNRMTADDLRDGLAAAIHVRVRDPAFSSQTKEKLISTEARVAAEAVIIPAFTRWLDTQPEEARLIIGRAKDAAEAREAAKKARELSRTKKTAGRISSTSLPEKLSDCSSKTPMAREVFLVEGDSAGGSAKTGRDREIQAILPLRGKILNVERAKPSAALKNAEIAAMIQTLGAGMGDKMDLSRLRYGKVVVMTDADVDGSHIATLILTFFFRMMRPLVEAGHLYIAAPPLYRVRRKGEEDIFVRNDRDLTGLFLDRAIATRALSSDEEILEGTGVRKSLEGMMDASIHAEAAARLLRHAALADAVMGTEEAKAIFGTGPITARKSKMILSRLNDVLEKTDPDGEWKLDIVGEEIGYGLSAIRHEDGLDTDLSLSRADLTSWQVVKVTEEYHATGLTGTTLAIGKNDIYGPVAFMDALREIGQKGAIVSRYKGLGEMNPDELWETTMDPTKRTLHRVRIEDCEMAEKIFSDLMADNVSARRALVEKMCAGDAQIDL
jgi:DNA gyrase subunit B